MSLSSYSFFHYVVFTLCIIVLTIIVVFIFDCRYLTNWTPSDTRLLNYTSTTLTTTYTRCSVTRALNDIEVDDFGRNLDSEATEEK